MVSSDRSKRPKRNSSNLLVAYHSGEWIASSELSVPVTDLAFTQSVTAVERVRAYGGQLFQLQRHLDRWQRTCHALKIVGLPSHQGLESLIEELIDRNSKSLSQWDDFGVLFVASPGCRSESPTLIIDLYPIHTVDVNRCVEKGSSLVVTDVHQPTSNCWPRDIKVRCRLHYYLADYQARQQVADSYGVLLDTDGTITETSVANILLVEAGKLVSPQHDQILPGISMQVVRNLAGQASIPWSEERITPQRLIDADEVLLTGTRCGVWFCNAVNGGAARTPGPCYRQLRREFDEFVGVGQAGT